MKNVETISCVVFYYLQVLFSTKTFSMGVNASTRMVDKTLNLSIAWPTNFSIRIGIFK